MCKEQIRVEGERSRGVGFGVREGCSAVSDGERWWCYLRGAAGAGGGGARQHGLIGPRFMSVVARLADAGEPALPRDGPPRVRYHAISWQIVPCRETLGLGDDDVDAPHRRGLRTGRKIQVRRQQLSVVKRTAPTLPFFTWSRKGVGAWLRYALLVRSRAASLPWC